MALLLTSTLGCAAPRSAPAKRAVRCSAAAPGKFLFQNGAERCLALPPRFAGRAAARRVRGVPLGAGGCFGQPGACDVSRRRPTAVLSALTSRRGARALTLLVLPRSQRARTAPPPFRSTPATASRPRRPLRGLRRPRQPRLRLRTPRRRSAPSTPPPGRRSGRRPSRWRASTERPSGARGVAVKDRYGCGREALATGGEGVRLQDVRPQRTRKHQRRGAGPGREQPQQPAVLVGAARRPREPFAESAAEVAGARTRPAT